ncbi:PLP-dependent aminotransferase family protein [Shimia litoralis]|uniref:PLP-dependent aminotransferase family protein n=1 Tax=Shimia litoralis TaxID=420403 RepID=A0A4U7N5J4_9RHOB|nr:PLP-dependent aminotransferase family protein [Shimia litoralis]TKZ21092.1 PLP-dependent aminotransferase family protein [Shimia litoralis]
MALQQMFAGRTERMKASEIRELLKLLDQPGITSFAGGIPDPDLFPADAFTDAFAQALSPKTQSVALQYSVSEGYLPLRKWIAGQMAKIDVPCDPENILITSGSQQALDYLGKLFLSPQDTALVGWPTYMGALGAFNPYEPVYGQLSVNGNRSAEDHAAQAKADGGRVKFAYLSADFANPTGETVDQRGRESVLELAEALDCAVIEDAAYQALRYDGDPVPSILALELARKGDLEACRTIYCGSFSKTLSPGLRVGWVVAAKPVISQLVLMKQAADLHSATINQMAICTVAESIFDSHVQTVRNVYSERRDCMLAALEMHMPEGVSWTKPQGGMFVWLTLPAHMDGAELLDVALDTEKVAFVPGKAFFADGSVANSLRLSFSCASPEMIQDGIRRLGRVIRATM